MNPTAAVNGEDPPIASPSAMDDYLFDLRGYLIVRDALSAAELAEINGTIDTFEVSIPLICQCIRRLIGPSTQACGIPPVACDFLGLFLTD